MWRARRDETHVLLSSKLFGAAGFEQKLRRGLALTENSALLRVGRQPAHTWDQGSVYWTSSPNLLYDKNSISTLS